MKIGVIGAGYVGTACDVGFSQSNIEVLVHDKYKPSESLHSVVSQCRVIFLCLPTPMLEDGGCDTSIIENVIANIDQCAQQPKTLVIKSTVPPGSTKRLAMNHGRHEFFFNPEFLTEANWLTDFLTQKFIVIGHPFESVKPQAKRELDSVYRHFTSSQKDPAEIIWVDSQQAEMFKYAANTFLATKVTFFNEIYEICAASGIRYDGVCSLLERDGRIGKTHTAVPGPDGRFGFGGSCFPKDTNALIAFAKQVEVDPLLLESVWTKNLIVRDEYEWENLAQVTGNYVSA